VAHARVPGPLGLETDTSTIDAGTLARSTSSRPGPYGQEGVFAEVTAASGEYSTVYYTRSGSLLFASCAKLPRALVVIPDGQLMSFKFHVAAIRSEGKQDSTISNIVARAWGTTYPIQDYRDFYVKWHGPGAKEDFLKYVEAGSALSPQGGVLNLTGPVSHANPENVLKTQQQVIMAGDNPRIHTHPDAVPGSGLSPEKVPSTTDTTNAPRPDEPFMNVMVRPDRMFLYNTAVIFIVNPDIFTNPPPDLTNSDLMQAKSSPR